MGLNPLAKPFTPASQQQQASQTKMKVCNDEAVSQNRQPAATSEEREHQGDGPGFLDLPQEVVVSILSCLDTAHDALHCGLTNKALLGLLEQASLHLDLSQPLLESLSAAAPSSQVQQMIAGLKKYMPGTVELDLSHLALEDRDVHALLASLPHLTQLDLSGCRRLTMQLPGLFGQMADRVLEVQGPGAAPGGSAFSPPNSLQRGTTTPPMGMTGGRRLSTSEGISSTGASVTHCGVAQASSCPHYTTSSLGGDVRQHMRAAALASLAARKLTSFCLQRCFQLNASALTQLLRAAAAGAVPLQCLALSHLNMDGWPWAGAGQRDSSGSSSATENSSFQQAVSVAFERVGAAARSRLAELRTTQHGPAAVLALAPAQAYGLQPPHSAAGAASSITGSSSITLHDSDLDEDDEEEGDEGGQGGGAETASSSARPSHDGCSAHMGAPLGLGTYPQQHPVVTNIQVLALNNCDRISALGLCALATACPRLQVLLLGGSTYSPLRASSGGAVAAGAAATGHMSGAALPASLQLQPRVRAELANTPAAVSVMGAAGVPGGPSVTFALDQASELVCAVMEMRSLRALDLTFVPQLVVTLVRQGLALAAAGSFGDSMEENTQPGSLSRKAGVLAGVSGASATTRGALGTGGSTYVAKGLSGISRTGRTGQPVEVLDLSQAWGVAAAVSLLQAASGGQGSSQAGAGASPARHSSPGGVVGANRGLSSHQGLPAAAAVRLGLKCAANCSSASRCTPLHIGSERGDAGMVRSLLSLGATPNAREKGGASPLFIACEAGHTGCVEALLSAGADVRLSNAAGESPLYISALRGHLPVVRALLAHCKASGIAWQEPKLYSDAWTPLMAAAVADRHDVALALLCAAGIHATNLVLARNRFGQSVVHIAARKGSAKLLRLLLTHGGCSSALAPDASGETPSDIARKHKHVVAVAELRRASAGHAAAPAGGRPPSPPSSGPMLPPASHMPHSLLQSSAMRGVAGRSGRLHA